MKPGRTGIILGNAFGGSIIILLLAVGCVTETQGPTTPHMQNLKIYSDQEVQTFKPLLSRYNLDPPLTDDLPGAMADKAPDLFKPYHGYSKRRYLNDDGTITMHYYLPAGTGNRIATMILGHLTRFTRCDGLPLKADQIHVIKDYLMDTRRSIGVGTTAFARYGAIKKNKLEPTPRSACDLMLVKAGKEALFDVEQFIARVTTEIPQIEIKVRVIEVSLQDKFEYGIDSLIYRVTSSEKSFLNTEFDDDGNYVSGGWTTKFNTESFLISGEEDFQGSIFHVAGEHDKLFLDALIEVVQKISESQILTAPKITVLDKHKAVIETGSDIPIQEIKTGSSQASYTYPTKPTGVMLAIIPSLLMDDMIQIEINGEVRTISSQEIIETADSTARLPVFANRNISTCVTVRDGEAFVIGGLLTRSEIEQISKVPLLGDIPILGYLFKSKTKELRKKEIIFYIEPRIVRPEETLYIPE